MIDKNKPYFVTSKNFHGDNDYIKWLKEIKNRYQNIRNRVALRLTTVRWSSIGF